ncbi:hypothetical protein MMC10_004006 [Thelotrema lepadinum]|nr:hypothetical protein [Thelotrema lepadinum]
MDKTYIDLAHQLEKLADGGLDLKSVSNEARISLYQAATKLAHALGTPSEPANAKLFGANGTHAIPASQVEEKIISQDLTAADINGLQKCLFDWADSYDQKDWTRLSNNVAPTIDLDYTHLGKPHWPSMPAAEYVSLVSAPTFIGSPFVMGQHLVGSSYWEVVGPDEVVGRHQIRVAHQVYTDASLGEVKIAGHAHASNVHRYRKIDNVWKLAGLKPKLLWGAGELERIWPEVKKMGEENGI